MGNKDKSGLDVPIVRTRRGTRAQSGKFWACTNLSPVSLRPADLPKQYVVLGSLRNFIEEKLQRSGGFAKIVRGFASANDAGGRLMQAP